MTTLAPLSLRPEDYTLDGDGHIIQLDFYATMIYGLVILHLML